ncbi:MAG: 4-hydroxyphenylpyruvate dioxygenase [Xenococcaceae cyanobacterium MO_167.B27]|nr:4-hydroxyphenylpyruvate dioxygenase [Xenococcaceae cyanobacterium MO_167.B27]
MKIDRVCFYVVDAAKTSNWLIHHLGFQLIKTYQDNHTYTQTVANGGVYFVIASPLDSCSPVAHYLDSHPEGIGDVTFCVSDLQSILNRAAELGVKILQPLHIQDKIKYARIAGWDSLEHTLIEYSTDISQVSIDAGELNNQPKLALMGIDHIVLNVAKGKIHQAVAYYQALFDFEIQQTFKIQTPKSGLYSEALIDRTGQIQFNINEPATPNSQIQEFIEINHGAGIQHLALTSHNIVETVSQMRSLGVEFLSVPSAYYTNLQQKLKRDSISISDSEFQKIAQQGILLDWYQHQPQSLLKQIFTKPILEQPTFFLEIIERINNAQGFGEGNFQALFEAVERNSVFQPEI